MATDLLVGRDPERTAIDEAMRAQRSVVIRGGPGLGKSALLRSALTARQAGRIIQGVRVFETVPYLPLRRAFSSLVDRSDPNMLAAAVRGSLLAEGPLVVDDLHWCDADTIAVLAELSVDRALVVTLRPDARPDVGQLVDNLAVEGAIIDLRPLDRAHAGTLLRASRPDASVEEIRRWSDAGQGNPLALRVAAFEARPPKASWGVTSTVLELEPAVLDDVARAAIIGDRHQLSDTSVVELTKRGLVSVDGSGRPGRLHDLVAVAAVDALDSESRARIHLDAARFSETPAERAVHLAAGSDAVGARDAALLAAAAAPTVWSRAEFLQLAARQPPRDPARVLEAADVLSLAGRYGEALELLGGPDGGGHPPEEELVIRARCHWTLTQTDLARLDIESGLASASLPAAAKAELLSLRSRIRCRVDWDLPGAVVDASAAADMGTDDPAVMVAAKSALGLALFMQGDARWQSELESAGEMAVRVNDLHNAVTIYDTMLFGHLLSGDPSRCVPLAAEMIEYTEHASAAWNGYFRCTSLLSRLHVDGDHRGVLSEVPRLSGRRLTTKSREALRTAHAFALIDAGDDLEAVDLADESLRRASDDSARSMACWALSDALWVSGDAERAVKVSDQARALSVGGFPGVVNAALMGAWARRDLRQPIDDSLIAAVGSGFPNLAGAAMEVDAIRAWSGGDPLAASVGFEQAAAAWGGTSVRASLRTAWAAAAAALDAGDPARAGALRLVVGRANRSVGVEWIHRRGDALVRVVGTAGGPVRPRVRGLMAEQVIQRVARGCTSSRTARALCISRATVETYLRRAIVETGAGTRLEAVALKLADRFEGPEVEWTDTVGGGTLRTRPIPQRAVHRSLADLPSTPWTLPSDLVATGELRHLDDVTAAVLALVRGAHLDVSVAPGDQVRHALLDALERIGRPARAGGETSFADLELSDDDRRVVMALGRGLTVTDAARELSWSRKTVQRRLASLRGRVGVASNSEAVLVLLGHLHSTSG